MKKISYLYIYIFYNIKPWKKLGFLKYKDGGGG